MTLEEGLWSILLQNMNQVEYWRDRREVNVLQLQFKVLYKQKQIGALERREH